MNVEDSYEGASERLRRLQFAGIDFAPPELENDDRERMRDLEQLATLACDENEQLQQQLDAARRENDRMQRLVTTLQEMLASAQSPEDEPPMVAKSSGRGLLYGIGIAAVGGIAALFLMLRPSAPLPIPAATVATTQPFVAAKVEPILPKVEPAVAKVEPTLPKVTATIPKVEPTLPKVAAFPTRTRPQRRHVAKHASAKSARREGKKRATAARASNKLQSRGDDPLAGLNL